MEQGVEPGVEVDRIITPEEMASRLTLSVKTVMRMLREGVIPAQPIRGKRRRTYRILLSEFLAWMKTPPPAPVKRGRVTRPSKPYVAKNVSSDW
jgi:excisionase family DNA binding protein